MDIVLNDDNQTITGSETITYVNNSPDNLEYLWVQLDQNVREKSSPAKNKDGEGIGQYHSQRVWFLVIWGQSLTEDLKSNRLQQMDAHSSTLLTGL